MKRRSAAWGIAALAAVAGAAVAVLALSPPRHADGEGPLGSLGIPMHESMSADATTGATTWTFGIPLCLATARGPAELERVEPLRTVGNGFEVLGMSVRTFEVTTEHPPIISVEGWPPPTAHVPDALSPVRSARVTTPCEALAVTSADTSVYTELLIGLEKRGSDGGGWEGILVHYRVGDRPYTLEIDRDLKICGDSTSCEIPIETPESGAMGDHEWNRRRAVGVLRA